MENLDSIIRRISKLLAIAQDDRADPAEAAAAAGMAERIMRKYQIENGDVIMAQLKAGDGMESADCLATAKTNGTKVVLVPVWCQQLAVAVGVLNDCRVILGHNANGEAVVRFQGFKADISVVVHTFNYLVATTNRLSRAFLKTAAYEHGGRKAVNSYRLGVTQGMLSSLAKLRKEKEAEQATTITGRDLVVCKKQAVTEHFGEMKTRKSKTSVEMGNSFAQGFVDGRQVDVARRAISTKENDSTLRIGV